MTSQLIGRFTAAAESATREAHAAGTADPVRRARCEVPAEIRHEVGVLKGIANLFVMQRSGSTPPTTGSARSSTSWSRPCRASPRRSLEPHFRPTWEHAGDDAARLRVVVDQVASLTDISVVAWHRAPCR